MIIQHRLPPFSTRLLNTSCKHGVASLYTQSSGQLPTCSHSLCLYHTTYTPTTTTLLSHPPTHLEVCWHCPVQLLGWRQAQAVHDLNKLLLGFCEPQVVRLLLPDAAGCAALVVVCGVHDGGVWQVEQLAVNRLVQPPSITCSCVLLLLWWWLRGGMCQEHSSGGNCGVSATTHVGRNNTRCIAAMPLEPQYNRLVKILSHLPGSLCAHSL